MGRKRNKTAAMLARFDRAESPLWVIDRELVIVYCNEACCLWLGKASEQLIGQACCYAALDGNQQGQLPLAPPPTLWESATPTTVPLTLGVTQQAARQVSFHPLLIAQQVDAVLAIASAADQPEPTATAEPTPAQLHRRLLEFRAEVAEHFQLQALIGDSPVMRMVRQQAELASGSPSHVLIVGEAGSGQERLAKTIHYTASAETASIATVACGITSAEMLQEAIKAFVRRREELEEQGPGTILLLEVDQLASSAQQELVGFLQLPQFHARLLGTSQQSLIELARADAFDPTLAYELSTMVIDLPPLRERRSDIPLLAQHYLEQAARRESDHPPSSFSTGFSTEAIELLMQYDWPRNLPQLEEAVLQACQQAEQSTVAATALPAYLAHAAEAHRHTATQWEPIELDAFLEEIEAELVEQTLKYCGGNKTKAAGLLGISRARMIRRVQQLGLEPGIDFEEI